MTWWDPFHQLVASWDPKRWNYLDETPFYKRPNCKTKSNGGHQTWKDFLSSHCLLPVGAHNLAGLAFRRGTVCLPISKQTQDKQHLLSWGQPFSSECCKLKTMLCLYIGKYFSKTENLLWNYTMHTQESGPQMVYRVWLSKKCLFAPNLHHPIVNARWWPMNIKTQPSTDSVASSKLPSVGLKSNPPSPCGLGSTKNATKNDQ